MTEEQMGTYNRTIFADSVRASLFGGRMSDSQWSGMEAMLDYADYLKWHPVDDERMYLLYWVAYMFATTFHETARTMQPIKEYGSQAYLQGKSYYPYFGRGLVQLTWEDNYRRSDQESTADGLIPPEVLAQLEGGILNQVGVPDQALNLGVALSNLFNGCHRGWYGGKLWTYLQNVKKDYVGARYCVNVQDKASTIAGYAEKFETALADSWQMVPVEVPDSPRPPPMPDPEELEKLGLFRDVVRIDYVYENGAVKHFDAREPAEPTQE